MRNKLFLKGLFFGVITGIVVALLCHLGISDAIYEFVEGWNSCKC